jgi:hypothetical protein
MAYNTGGMRRLHVKSADCFMRKANAIMLIVFGLFSALCPADTFTNRKSGEILHGYKTSRVEGAETAVQTIEKGLINLNLAEWQVTANRSGRNNKVVVMESYYI